MTVVSYGPLSAIKTIAMGLKATQMGEQGRHVPIKLDYAQLKHPLGTSDLTCKLGLP